MFVIGHNDGPRPKCYFTHSVLPAYVDHEQPSQKKKPFSTIQEHAFVHTLDILLPSATCSNFLTKLNGKGTLNYSKVYLKLLDIVSGDFFNTYIKAGNILLLSEGRPKFDNIFSLHEGILCLELDKATYERTGLSGTPIPSDGRKHVKARYAVEINLRLPSMVRGKHGFERVVWAFKNVLDARLTWLFYDLKGANDGCGPIAAHSPIVKSVEPNVEEIGEVLVPPLPEEIEVNDQKTPAELLEWLMLALKQSSRVQNGDKIDSYLSRYCVPDVTGEEAEPAAQKLSKIQWHGFIPASFVHAIVIAALKARGEGSWFALSSHGFDGKIHAFIQHGQHTFNWAYED